MVALALPWLPRATSRNGSRRILRGSIVALSGLYLVGAVLMAGALVAHPGTLPAAHATGAVRPMAKLLPGDNGTEGNGSSGENDQGGDNSSSVCSGDGGNGYEDNGNSQGNDSQGNSTGDDGAQGDEGTGNTSSNTSFTGFVAPLDGGSSSNDSGENETGDNGTGDQGSGNQTSCAADPPVTFKALGLPSGSTWSVTAGSPPLTITNTTVGHKGTMVFNVTDGLLNYTISPPAGYGVAKIVGPGVPSMTSDLINGTTVLTVKFAVFEQLTFSEKGLPAGSVWAITIWNSLPHGGPSGHSASNTTSASGGTISFTVVKGSWKYNVTESPANYTAHPHKGAVGVPGHAVTRHLRFHVERSTQALEPSPGGIAAFVSRVVIL